MNRPFTPDDNEQLFRFEGHLGRLEYPLEDPGSAEPGEGIIWYLRKRNGAGWDYVKPSEVEPA
jgi:hypothetical protein